MIEVLTVKYRGAELCAFRVAGVVFVAVRPIVEAIGLSFATEVHRIRRDPVLAEGTTWVNVPAESGHPQRVQCLKLDLIIGWLFKIESGRFKKDVRNRIELYQSEFFGVLCAELLNTSGDSLKEEHVSQSLKIRMVGEARLIFGGEVAAELWVTLGLPLVSSMRKQRSRQLDLFEDAA